MHPQGKKWGCTCTPCPPCSYPSENAAVSCENHRDRLRQRGAKLSEEEEEEEEERKTICPFCECLVWCFRDGFSQRKESCWS